MARFSRARFLINVPRWIAPTLFVKVMMGTMAGRKRGFTLVELLVVIGIIAVLISLLLPALSRARRAANSVKCLANLHTLSLAYAQYVVANHGRSVVFIHNNDIGGTKDPDYITWQEQLRPYYGKRLAEGQVEDTQTNIRLCPEESELLDPTFATPEADAWGTARLAWNYKRTDTSVTTEAALRLFSSYGINGWVYEVPATDPTSPFYSSTQDLISYGQNADLPQYLDRKLKPGSRKSAETPFIGDCIRLDAWPQPKDQGPVDGNYSLNAGQQSYVGNNMGRFVINRHGRNVNMAFMDGHASAMPLRDLWALNWYNGWTTPDSLPAFPAQ